MNSVILTLDLTFVLPVVELQERRIDLTQEFVRRIDNRLVDTEQCIGYLVEHIAQRFWRIYMAQVDGIVLHDLLPVLSVHVDSQTRHQLALHLAQCLTDLRRLQFDGCDGCLKGIFVDETPQGFYVDVYAFQHSQNTTLCCHRLLSFIC